MEASEQASKEVSSANIAAHYRLRHSSSTVHAAQNAAQYAGERIFEARDSGLGAAAPPLTLRTANVCSIRFHLVVYFT